MRRYVHSIQETDPINRRWATIESPTAPTDSVDTETMRDGLAVHGAEEVAAAVSLSLFGVIHLQPDPVMIGLHLLALIAHFQLPLSIMIHWVALQTPIRHYPIQTQILGTNV